MFIAVFSHEHIRDSFCVSALNHSVCNCHSFKHQQKNIWQFDSVQIQDSLCSSHPHLVHISIGKNDKTAAETGVPWVLMQQPSQPLSNFPGQTECWTSWQKAPLPQQGLTWQLSSGRDRGSAARWWHSLQCSPLPHILTKPIIKKEQIIIKNCTVKITKLKKCVQLTVQFLKNVCQA